MMTKLNIYRLLDIKPDSKKLWIILLLPFYSLWLLAIGKRLIGKQKKSDKFFTIITFLFFVLNVIQLIAMPFIGVDFPKVHRQEFIIYGQIYFLLFFLSLIILTNITVKYDRHQNKNKYYSINDFGDYIRRFFGFIYWPFFIWTYQRTVNEYNEDKMPSR